MKITVRIPLPRGLIYPHTGHQCIDQFGRDFDFGNPTESVTTKCFKTYQLVSLFVTGIKGPKSRTSDIHFYGVLEMLTWIFDAGKTTAHLILVMDSGTHREYL